MPLIWNEAAQEQSYLTAVEFSTLASDVSPEAIKQVEVWGVLSGWKSWAMGACGSARCCWFGPVFTGEGVSEWQDGEITMGR